jgi:hypothetical protein
VVQGVKLVVVQGAKLTLRLLVASICAIVRTLLCPSCHGTGGQAILEVVSGEYLC